MDVCNLGRTKMILGMPWLAAHNPEINWETVWGWKTKDFGCNCKVLRGLAGMKPLP